MSLNQDKTKFKIGRVFCLVVFLSFLLWAGTGCTQENRINEWREDLNTLKLYLPALDKSFTPSEAYVYSNEPSLYVFSFNAGNILEDFYRKTEELDKRIPELSDNEMIVELAKLVALSNNAHTRIYLLRNRTVLNSFPIRMYWFSDGLYVIKASRDYSEALKCRVIKIGNKHIDEVKSLVNELYAGNESWKKYKSLYYMNSPEILHGLHIIYSDKEAVFTFERSDGTQFNLTLVPQPLLKSDKPRELNIQLSPFAEDNFPLVSAMDEEQIPLPLYLKNPNLPYWYSYLDNSRSLYFQHNRVTSTEDMMFTEFGKKLIEIINTHEIKKLIVDLRFNTGGNLIITYPFITKLAEVIPENIQVFTIVSESTFSAGISNVLEYKKLLNAYIVGEPVGDYLISVAEGGRFYLPNSKLEIKYANGFHDWTCSDLPELDNFLKDESLYNEYVNRTTERNTLINDLYIYTSSQDYFSGKDPKLKAILDFEIEE